MHVGRAGAADVGTFVPKNSETMQIFDGGVGEFPPATLRIQIFDAQNERSRGFAATVRGKRERLGVSEMEKARGRGRNSASIRH